MLVLDAKPTLFMMIGLPASGKSTKAEKLAREYDANIHSSDSIREELSGDVNNQDINGLVFETLHNKIKEDLLNGHNTIYDACNISYKRRRQFLQSLNKIPCMKVAMLIATPYCECIQRNELRYRKVPIEVIKKMYLSFNVPYWYEGWDDIKLIRSEINEIKYPIRYIDMVMDFNQNNKHHELTLGEHLRDTLIYVQDRTSDDHNGIKMRIAAALHDCGKPFTKEFKNAKGESSEDAHYYSHNCCGAYDSLFYKTLINSIDYAVIIMWHMQPYFWERDNNEKLHNKYKKLWGEQLYNDIMLLHEADKSAH